MRVLHVVKSLRQGGAEVVVMTLTRHQTAMGHKVATIAHPGVLDPDLAGLVYPMTITGGAASFARAACQVAVAIRRFRPDVVHAHNPGMMLVAAIATANGSRAPMLTTLHGGSSEDYARAGRLGRLTRTPLVACGPAVATSLASLGYPVAATVLNGVPQQVVPSKSSARDELAMNQDWFTILQVGRLESPKDPLLAIRAFARASSASWRLLFAGVGEGESEARQLVAQLGIMDQVLFLGRRTDIPLLMAAADAVLLSSEREGLPLVILEAAQVGRPVVGTRVPGIQELVTDGVDGLLSDRTPDALAAAITRLYIDHELRNQLQDASALRASEFSADAMTSKYQVLYERFRSHSTRSPSTQRCIKE